MNTQYPSFAGSSMSTDPDITNRNNDREPETSMKGIATTLQLCCLRFTNDIVHMVTTGLRQSSEEKQD